MAPGVRVTRRRRTGPLLALFALAIPPAATAQPLFEDDFEHGLGGWQVSDPRAVTIVDSGDATHGGVLRLAPAGARLHALIRGSESWPAYRIEGELLFPTAEHNYLGLIYHYRDSGRRVDLGSIYIKGNGSYIRVNPRRDWNPARMLYEEYRTELSGPEAITIGEWQRFAFEVAGAACHLYVGDLTTPKVTFDLYEADSGRVGFKPRVVGGPVWLDNLRVTAIERLSYRGPRRPLGITYDTADAILDWEVLGPLTRTVPEVEQSGGFGAGAERVEDDGRELGWEPFAADPRGAVLTARVTEYLGSRTVAYFRTRVDVPAGWRMRVEYSSLDNLVFWTDGVFDGYFELRDGLAWHDFGRNPEHPRTNGYGELGPGSHRLLVRVRGGQYATGGFFARLVPEPPSPSELTCPPVPGVESLLERAAVVLVGEIHGTAESPAFVAALACRALAASRSVTVGFELAESEEGRFSAYLGSDGSAEARAALLGGPPWQATGTAQYGATSEAMVALLEELRMLRRRGYPVSFAFFNRSDRRDSRDRDRKMAATLTALIDRSASDLFIALTGNIHSRLASGTPWDPRHEPMGYLVRRARPDLELVALDVAHAGGSAWLCTAEGCGEHPLGGRGEPGGERFAITLDAEPRPDGHHGSYYVGEIHASPPAVSPGAR
jgi:hypothetical protein